MRSGHRYWKEGSGLAFRWLPTSAGHLPTLTPHRQARETEGGPDEDILLEAVSFVGKLIRGQAENRQSRGQPA